MSWLCSRASACSTLGGALPNISVRQMAEWLENRASHQKVAGSIPGLCNVMSLGKALHSTCLGGNVPVLTVSRSG